MNKIEIKVPMLGKEGLEEILKLAAEYQYDVVVEIDDWIAGDNSENIEDEEISEKNFRLVLHVDGKNTKDMFEDVILGKNKNE